MDKVVATIQLHCYVGIEYETLQGHMCVDKRTGSCKCT